MELLAGREGAVAQVVRTVPGRRYALSFTVGDAGNACRGSLVVEAYAGRESVKVAYESEGKGGARRAVLPFRAVAARTRIVFFSSFYSKCEVPGAHRVVKAGVEGNGMAGANVSIALSFIANKQSKLNT
nr:uncharacterized protein LOC117844490 [Setaria viridis]